MFPWLAVPYISPPVIVVARGFSAAVDLTSDLLRSDPYEYHRPIGTFPTRFPRLPRRYSRTPTMATVSVASQAPLGIGMLLMSGLSFAAVVGVYQLLPTEQDMDDKTCDCTLAAPLGSFSQKPPAPNPRLCSAATT